MIDAVAFALALPLPRGKHAHVRDLVYCSSSGSGDDDVSRAMQGGGVGEQEEMDASNNHTEKVMFVRLNFENGVSLKRTYTVKDQISEQSVF